MFKTGDKILHPLHGVGIIESVQTQQILGEAKEYFMVNLSLKKMRIMIPVDKCEDIGIRRISNMEHIEEAFDVLKSKKTVEMPANWNRRYKFNLDRLKTGNVCEIAGVLKSLSAKEKRKGLSMGEKRMLENVRQIFAGEIAAAKRCKVEQAITILDSAIH
jgi:CarD family transcriptional regulator